MPTSKVDALRLPAMRAGLAALALCTYFFAQSSSSHAGGPPDGGHTADRAAAAAHTLPLQIASPSPSPNASPSPSPNASPSPGASPSPQASPSPDPSPSPSPSPGPTPGATPGEFEIEAPLAGAAIGGVVPFGRAKFEVESGRREFEAEVRNVNLPRGTALRVFVDGALASMLTLDDQQRGRIRLRTDDGQAVPEVTSRTRVVVADQGGATLLAGSFSSTPPAPNPTPVPTPTPGAGGETRVEALLAGAAIGGLTPRGDAEFRAESSGRRRLRVEVEKVNLPADSVLRVMLDGALVGRITLGSSLEGRLDLDTEDGHIVPQLQANSTVVVANAAGATLLSATFNRPVAPTGTNNDIDNTTFFVAQQYKDFLDREPDDSGLNFWSAQIAACGDDVNCRAGARANTSGAFFLSIEFQSTGYLLYRFNRVSFGTMPRRTEFLIDMQRVAQGVVVGRAGWEELLEANKRALANEWVARPEFVGAFGSLSNAQYVNALFVRAGVTPSQAERDALVAGLGAGTETRATVLRRVAENPTFVQRERNPAFVLMQYFGYLHRNPDEGPDDDLSGFNFWLGKLNDHGGDFHRAEMVKSFLNASEYRARFRW